MKKWGNPKIENLGINDTKELYVDECYWNGAVEFGNEYTDPNKKPDKKPDWVWCKFHGSWHPKDHTAPGQS